MNPAKEKAELADVATRKMEDAIKKAEIKAELARESTLKMTEAMKKIEDEKMEMELHLADFLHEHQMKADASTMKMKRIKKICSSKGITYAVSFGCYCYSSRGCNRNVRIFKML